MAVVEDLADVDVLAVGSSEHLVLDAVVLGRRTFRDWSLYEMLNMGGTFPFRISPKLSFCLLRRANTERLNDELSGPRRRSRAKVETDLGRRRIYKYIVDE